MQHTAPPPSPNRAASQSGQSGPGDAMRAVVAVFVVSVAINVIMLITSPVDWYILPALLIGWYLADFASGAVHMYMDYRPCPKGTGLDKLYFYPGSRDSEEYQALRQSTMRRVGWFERLVYDFKVHHPRPLSLGRRSLLYQIGATIAAASLPFSLALNVTAILVSLPAWLIAGCLSLLIGGTFAQFFHGSLHREDVPLIVVIMRACGLLMSPAAHQLHHDSLKRDFATNNGWSNPVLNRVFAVLHRRGILRDDGLEPQRDDG